MSLTEWFKNKFSKSPDAMSLYKRGIHKAKLKDLTGAIEDYSSAIELSGSQPNVKAMAIYNRALVFAAERDYDRAIDDLGAVLKMRDAPADVKAAAKQKLSKIERRTGKGTNSKTD